MGKTQGLVRVARAAEPKSPRACARGAKLAFTSEAGYDSDSGECATSQSGFGDDHGWLDETTGGNRSDL
jgi:hypothetical protein